jgi:hypothetical protein
MEYANAPALSSPVESACKSGRISTFLGMLFVVESVKNLIAC